MAKTKVACDPYKTSSKAASGRTKEEDEELERDAVACSMDSRTTSSTNPKQFKTAREI